MTDDELSAIEARAGDWTVDGSVTRNDVEDLVAEVRRLGDERAALRAEVEQLKYEPCGNCAALETSNAGILSEVERLRAALLTEESSIGRERELWDAARDGK